MIQRLTLLTLLTLLLAVSAFAGETTDDMLRKDRVFSETWVYDDIEKGFAEAKSSGKPMLVVFRCVP